MRHRPLANLLLTLGSILVGLLVAEGVVRLAGLAPQIKRLELAEADSVYRRSDNPILGFELKASYRNDAADFSRTYPSTNRHGQRDVERSLAKPPGTRRVILLGDSVVEGHGIQDLDDTLSRRLERLLEPERTEVLNFGVSGYCTRAEIELLRVKGLAFDPDVVIVVFTSNDFDNFNREAFELGAARERPAAVEGLFSGSHLFRLLAVRLDLWGFGAQTDPVRWNREAMGDNNVVDGFRLLRELAEAGGFRPLIAVWPVFDDARVLDAHTMPDGDELVVERLAAAEGLPAVRLSTFFEADRASRPAPANPRLLYTIGDGLHPNPEGARIGARALAEVFRRLDELAPPAPAPPTQPGDAVDLARTLGSAEPGYAHVHNNAGVDLLEAGRLDEAAAAFRRALRSDPGFAEARSNLAGVLLRRGEPEEALKLYREALALRPDQPDLHYNVALLLERLGKPAEARVHLEQALRLRPGFDLARKKLEALP